MTNTLRYALFAHGLTSLMLVGCSVDAGANPAWGCDDACKEAGRCVLDMFCLLGGSVTRDAAVDGGAADGGRKDGGGGGAGGDGGASGTGGPNMSCEGVENGRKELCYDGAEGTALQSPCRAGEKTCEDGVWSVCVGQVLPQAADSCNGVDDDCDGKTDEGVPVECQDAERLGACKTGIGLCQAGMLKCLQMVFPSAETCDADGVDEDCDGKADIDDEDLGSRCYTGASGCTEGGGVYSCVGACQPGRYRCVGGQIDTNDCHGEVTPADQDPCTAAGSTAVDDDCDGKTDEDCLCTDGAEQGCYSGPSATQGVGLCHGGTQTCSGNQFGPCMNETTPVSETCTNQGADDDCNNVVDDVPGRGTACTTTGSEKGECAKGTMQCKDGSLQCALNMAVEEVCGNGKDDDCDGKTDEGFDLDGDDDNCGACGVKCGPGLSCCKGTCVNTGSSNNFCGSCSNSCATGHTCCRGMCVNTNNDEAFCGSCDNRCANGWGCCSGTCRNHQSDNNHCGSCGTRCGLLIGGLLGQCQMGKCK